jgi:hypothetical protein
MTIPTFDVLLDRPDALTGEPFPLRARVRMRVTPAASGSLSPTEATCVEWLREALESAVMIGQDRYGVPRRQVGRGSVEAAARASLEYLLARASHRLDTFELLSLDPAD